MARRIIDQQEAQSLSDQDYLIADNTNLGTRKISFPRLLVGATPLPMGYIYGLSCDYVNVNKFTINTGVARSSDNLRNMELLSSLTKDINKSFELGADGGCMPNTLTLKPTTKYYIFLISSSAGLTDIVIDENENCNNGLNDSVVKNNNFDKYVNIGYLKTDLNADINEIYSNSIKLNTDLSNITDAGKTNIVNLFAVSNQEINISTPYTVEKAGMVTFRVYTQNNIATAISVNGIMRFYGNIVGVRDGVYSIYVFPGDVVTGQGVNGKTFSPLKIYEEEGV